MLRIDLEENQAEKREQSSKKEGNFLMLEKDLIFKIILQMFSVQRYCKLGQWEDTGIKQVKTQNDRSWFAMKQRKECCEPVFDWEVREGLDTVGFTDTLRVRKSQSDRK